MDLLETPTLLLRPLEVRDRDFVFALLGCPLVRRYLGGPVPFDQRAEVFEGYLGGGAQEWVWLVQTRACGRSLGTVFLGPYREGDGLELSYQFAASAWGQGHASAAAGAVVEYGLNTLSQARLVAETQSANAASCRLLERLGFTEQRRLERFGALQSVYAGPC